jgi:polyisoprenoid-binding protein YceI
MKHAPQKCRSFRCVSFFVGAVALLPCAQIALAQRTALTVDTAVSHIFAITHRTGLLSFLGHEHVILAPRWTNELCIDRASPGESYARFVIDARALVIDADSARRLAGLGRGPSANQRSQIQEKMLDAQHLNVAEFPELTFESVNVATDDWRTLQIQGHLTMRGVTREMTFPASLQQESDGRTTLSAVMTVKQSAFGIKPESIAGVVRVSDPVDLHIRLAVAPSLKPCR